jgi:MarR family transcriptional regulator for hemolysin
LHATARAWRLALDRHLRASGTSFAGWSAVAVAAAARQPMSQSELAQALGVEAATLVTTIDKLEQAGMVERMHSPSDRRIRLVVVTQLGQALSLDVEREASALRRRLLRKVDAGRMELATTLLEELLVELDDPLFDAGDQAPA